MKLLFSDIHSSKRASQDIEAVAGGFDELICAGDICGYNTDLEYVIDMLIDLDVKTVRGNHDEMVLDEDYNLSPYPDFITEPVLWARENLKGKYREYMESLPEVYEEGNIFVTHTHPVNDYIFVEDSARLLLDQTDKDIIVIGHTHTQNWFRFDRRSVINPGSITHGRRGHSRGYALLDGNDVIFEELGSITT